MLKHLALMSSLLLPIAAYAQTAEQPTEQAPGAESHSWKTDPQGNAMFSREDTAIAFPRLSGHFDEIDADKDGYLSRAEIREWHQATHQGKEKQKDAAPKEGMRQGKMKQAADRFKEADKNGDGKFSREEAKAIPDIGKNFDAIDADKDGQVTRDEISAWHKATHKGKGMKDDAMHGDMHHGMKQKAADRFKEADKNSDGKLSREEAKAMPHIDKNFDAIDADKDGQVTPDEIRAAMKAKAKTEEQPKK